MKTTRKYTRSLPRRVLGLISQMDTALCVPDVDVAMIRAIYKEWRKEMADVMEKYETKKRLKGDRRMGKNIPKEWWGGPDG